MKRIPDEVSGSAGPAVENWARSFWSTTSESPDLPPHHPDCLGCGPQNPHGHALSVQRDENGVVAHHVFDQRHVGAPGIAHGARWRPFSTICSASCSTQWVSSP